MIKAVIFDCFGVIVSDSLTVMIDELSSSRPDEARDIREMMRACNQGLLDSETVNKHIADVLGLDYETYRQKVRDGELKDARVLNLIKELRKSYKTAMLSNITVSGMERRFSEAERAEYFDEIVVSAAIGYLKPDPEAYTITAEKLGVKPEECVFIDDKDAFCEAARVVGMQAVWYRDFETAKADLEKILA
jgi:epoxide hydrolase-like predicted phosphatase